MTDLLKFTQAVGVQLKAVSPQSSHIVPSIVRSSGRGVVEGSREGKKHSPFALRRPLDAVDPREIEPSKQWPWS